MNRRFPTSHPAPTAAVADPASTAAPQVLAVSSLSSSTPDSAGSPIGRPTVGADDRFLRMREVTRMVGLSPSTVYQLVKDGKFPAAFRLGPSYSRWLQSEVLHWMQARVAESPRTTARRVS